jgi:hypothetical protein
VRHVNIFLDMLAPSLFLCLALIYTISASICNVIPANGVSVVVYCVNDGNVRANVTVGCLTTTKIETYSVSGPLCEMRVGSRTFELLFQPNVRSEQYGCATTLTFADPNSQVVCA